MSHLSIVRDTAPSPGRSAIQLMAEAKAAGEQQVTLFLGTLQLAIQQAREIVDGGDVYPAGVRDVAGRLAEHSAWQAQSIVAIMRTPSRDDSEVRRMPDLEAVDAEEVTPEDLPIERELSA